MISIELIKSLTHLSMSAWEEGEGDMLNPSKSADSRIALFFLRPGHGGIIMSAIELVTVQLLHGSGIGPIGPCTQPAAQRGILGAALAGGNTQIGLPGAAGGAPLGHITVAATQPQPVAHVLVGAAAAIAGAPGGSKGAVWSHDRFEKQSVEVVWVEMTVVLVT